MNPSRTPSVRFKGYEEDWEERKLGELSNIVGGGTPSTSNPEYWDGDIDWYAPAEIGEQSYVSKSKKTITELGLKKSSARILPVGTVLFTSRAGIGNTAILAKEATTNQGFQSIVPDQNKLDSYFIYSRTNELKRYGEVTGAGSTFVEVSGKQMSKMSIMVPELSEQQKIGSFFKQLDDTIVLHQRKLNLMKEQKKGFLQKMFPKNGEKIPEIRFACFTDAWEERKLGELVEQIIREVPKPNKPYYRMSVRSHAKGTFKQFVDNPENVAMDKLFVVKKDDLVVNITFAWEHAIAVVNEENDGLLVSHRFPTYRADGKSDIEFLHHVVSKENFRRKLEFISPGGAGRNRVLNKKDFLKLKMFVPKIEEQQKIGSFFKQLDNTIALHQRKIDELKLMKKSMLQKMFV